MVGLLEHLRAQTDDDSNFVLQIVQEEPGIQRDHPHMLTAIPSCLPVHSAHNAVTEGGPQIYAIRRPRTVLPVESSEYLQMTLISLVLHPLQSRHAAAMMCHALPWGRSLSKDYDLGLRHVVSHQDHQILRTDMRRHEAHKIQEVKCIAQVLCIRDQLMVLMRAPFHVRKRTASRLG